MENNSKYKYKPGDILRFKKDLWTREKNTYDLIIATEHPMTYNSYIRVVLINNNPHLLETPIQVLEDKRIYEKVDELNIALIPNSKIEEIIDVATEDLHEQGPVDLSMILKLKELKKYVK